MKLVIAHSLGVSMTTPLAALCLSAIRSNGIADGIILTLINHQKMKKKGASTVFRVGSGRWTKIRRSTSATKPSSVPYGLNGTQITKRDLKILDQFLESLDVELGYQL
jgi:hypothetical protein